jgi:phage-related protein/predicted XRE-type DNA-binding protein
MRYALQEATGDLGMAGDEPARKPLIWLHGEIKTPPFSPAGRQEAGMLLRLLQEGERLTMPQAEALPAVGPRCGALLVRDAVHNWRIMFRIDTDAVVILEVYPKKTRTIPGEVIDRCQQRLKKIRRRDQSVEEKVSGANRSPSLMDATKRKAIEAAGWKVGDAADFLEMSAEERQLLDARVELALAIRQQRKAAHLSQKQLGARLKTSQPRVAKIERAASDVSMDQLVRALTAAGGSFVVKSAAVKAKKGKRSPSKKGTIVIEVAMRE